MSRAPRWYRRLPASAKVIGLENYVHCAARAEVMTPDAHLREIACGKPRRGHGRWHENRGPVRWRGRWERPTYMTEWIENEAAAFVKQLEEPDVDP